MKNIKKIRVSGSDIFVFKKKTILMSLCLIFVLLEFGSCSQLFNTPSSGNNSSGTTGYTGCIFKISVTTPDGCVSSDILGTTGTKSAVSRSVFPVIPTNYKAKIWTTGSTVPDTWISPESGTNLTFNFGSVAAAAYTVRLGFFTDSSDAAPSFYADGTVTVTKGQTSADCTVSILPDNCTAGDGTTTTGSISLELTDEATEIKSFSASLVNSSSTTLLTVTQKTGASDSSTYAIIGTGFSEGTYTLKIYGLDSSGNIIYRYPSDVLYVWPGLTTNTWYLNDDTKPASLDITEDMYKTALATTIYVSENGSDTGDGGYYKPFKTVQHAVNCCTDTAINGTDGTGYTIYIDGKITLSSNSDDTDTIMIDNSKKITFAGLKGASTDIIDGGKAYQILTVSSGSTVTIVDLMLQNGYTSGNGGCISNAGTLTINGSTITGCTAVNGGGVYNSGTLTMTGGTITGNTASSGGSGVYNSGTFNISGSAVVDANSNDVYLADGCVITVTGDLSETTVAEITMQYPVPGTEVLAFSGVSGSENICIQFTYENDNTDGTTDPDGSTTINENDGRDYALHYGSSSGILTCDRFYVEGNNSTELTESGTGTQTQSDTTGSPDYADGSKQKPFAGVQKAASLISTFPSAADPTGGYTIYIDGTVSLSSTINISTKKELTLEGMSGSGTDILNGGHTSGGTDGCQILNIALGSTVTMENLTLKNGYSSGNGGGVSNAGTFNMESGTIKACSAGIDGGGVYNKGTFNMYGGTIGGTDTGDGNSATNSNGGGIRIYNGSFVMSGGTISGNSATYGGGVYIGSSGGSTGTFTMSGGTVTANTASDKGSGVFVDGTFNISGCAVIDAETTGVNDVYLTIDPNCTCAIYIAGTLTPESNTTLSSSGAKYSAEITPQTTADETVILKSMTSLDYATINKFTLNVTNRCPVLSSTDNTEAVIGKLSVPVSGLPASLSLSAEYDATSYKATVTVKDGSADISKELTSWTITVLDSSNRETGVTATATESTTGTAPNVTLVLSTNSSKKLLDGTYNLLVVFTYNTVSYSATVTINTALVQVAGGTGTLQGRNVTLSSFSMGKYEVTYGLWYTVYQWAASVDRGDNKYTFANAGTEGNDGTPGAAPADDTRDEPVTKISWRDCIIWCNAYTEYTNALTGSSLSPAYCTDSGYTTPLRAVDSSDTITTGLGTEDNPYLYTGATGYRLPTEAEWEWAARGGDPSTTDWKYTYAGSNTVDDVAWYQNNSGGTTHPAGLKTANSLGLYDMNGNVWEWCWDWYGNIGTTEETNPTGPATGSHRARKGGGYNTENGIHVSSRCRDSDPWFILGDIGFRVCRTTG